MNTLVSASSCEVWSDHQSNNAPQLTRPKQSRDISLVETAAEVTESMGRGW